MRRQRIGSLLFLIFLTLAFASVVPAQQKERTLDEIKAEAIKRAENGMYPLIGLDPADCAKHLLRFKTSDNDEWASGFSAVADRYTWRRRKRLKYGRGQGERALRQGMGGCIRSDAGQCRPLPASSARMGRRWWHFSRMPD